MTCDAFPEITALEITEGRAELDMRLPEDLIYFQGHFPSAAILPGVVQIHWAILWGRRYLNVDGVFAGMTQVKFHMPARPGDTLRASLEWDAEQSLLSFRYTLDGRVVSSGRIRLS